MARGGKKKKQGGAAKARAAQRKTDDKKRNRIAADKTFGLKNKNKSKKVQAHIATIHRNAKQGGRTRDEMRAEARKKEERKLARAAKEAEKKQNIALGITDASGKKTSKVCSFFLAGKCQKGKRCRFSHTAPPEQKKLSVYQDVRDTMKGWDQKTLEDVVAGKDKKTPNQTDIICKYFLDAIAKQLYGHFWMCPNGNSCIYRHCLPPGYVLKTPTLDADGGGSDVDIGEKIEEERKKLNLMECTPLTHDVFLKWKQERKEARDKEIENERKAAERKGGRANALQILSGKALFEFDASLFEDDEGAAGADDLEIREEDEDEEGEENEGDEKSSGADLKTQAWAAAEPPAADATDGKAAPAADATDGKAAPAKKKIKKKKKKKKKKKPAASTAISEAPTADTESTSIQGAAPVDASLFMDDEDLPDFD